MAVSGELKLLGQQILGEEEKRDAHQSQGDTSLIISARTDHPGGLKMLRPAEAHTSHRKS
jgi:hypothetical protein